MTREELLELQATVLGKLAELQAEVHRREGELRLLAHLLDHTDEETVIVPVE